MSTKLLQRRRFLQSLGLGAAALSMPRVLEPGRAKAGADCPLRIVFVYDTVGFKRGMWEPSGPDGTLATLGERAWEFSDLLSPLQPWKDRAIVLDGMDMISDEADPTGAGNAHKAGMTSALTGAFRLDADTGGGISINQAIAQHLNSPVQQTRLTSFEVAIKTWGNTDHEGTYSAPGVPVPFIKEPDQAYDRLFPAELRSDDAARQAARRGSIFNLIRGDGEALLRDLPAEGREKIVQHMDTLTALEARLNLGAGRAGNIPPRDLVAPWEAIDYRYNPPKEEQGRYWSTQAELNVQLAAAALHADITRVVTLNVNHAADHLWGYDNGAHGSSDWHDFVHETSGDDPDNGTPTAQGLLRGLHDQSVGVVERLLTELERRIEPDGSSLLDHTVVVMCSELSEGSHDLTRLPWHVFGDAHGQWRTGRYIQFPRLIWRGRGEGSYAPRTEWARYNQRGRPHNDLFVSLLNAFGAETDTFGEPSVCTGPIGEMT